MKKILIGAVFGFLYALLGYGSFLLWNTYELSRPPMTYATKMDGFVTTIFIGFAGLASALIFQPASAFLALFTKLGLPVFIPNDVPFPYHESIPMLGVLLGFILLISLGAVCGYLFFLLAQLRIKRKSTISQRRTLK